MSRLALGPPLSVDAAAESQTGINCLKRGAKCCVDSSVEGGDFKTIDTEVKRRCEAGP